MYLSSRSAAPFFVTRLETPGSLDPTAGVANTRRGYERCATRDDK
jgi:hypothetical protein